MLLFEEIVRAPLPRQRLNYDGKRFVERDVLAAVRTAHRTPPRIQPPGPPETVPSHGL
jgi:hypothetical protein